MPDDSRPKHFKDADPGAAIVYEQQCAQALKLRVEGMSYRAIARAMKCGVASAYQYVNSGWERLIEDNDEIRQVLRAAEIDRMEEMIDAVWKLAVGDISDLADDLQADAAENQLRAVQTVLKLQQTICRLLGLYAPTKVEHTKKSELTPIEELMAKVAQNETKFAGMRRGNRIGQS